jgi:DNA-directed RNA polymerase
MSDTKKLAHVLRQYEVFRKGPDSKGGGDFHKGLNHLRNVDQDRVADRVLQRDWHNRKAVASMFKMAESVERLLHLNLSWKERCDLGRLLISSLCYAGLYRLEKEDERDIRSPYFIVRTGQSLSVDNTPPQRTSPDKPFPSWTHRFDDDGNRLVKPSYPSPPNLEFDPEFPRTVEDEQLIHRAWYLAVHKLEHTAFRINEEVLDWVIETDKKEATRIIPKTYKPEKKEREALKKRKVKEGIKALEKKWNDHDKEIWKEQKKRDKKRASKRQEKLEWRDDYRMTHDELKTLFKYWGDRKRLKEKIQSVKARRKRFEDERDKAIELKGKVFYQRVKMCYRGRMYYPSDFSIQGTDFARAVIEFADPDGLNADASDWLRIHAGNMYGMSGDVEVRARESREKDAEYMAIGVDPIGQFSNWKKAEKPYSFLRACLEITDELGLLWRTKEGQEATKKESKKIQALCRKAGAKSKKYSEGIITNDDMVQMPTRLPVELDQSASAYQHIALLMGDKKLLKEANAGEVWSDLYREVAKDEGMQREGLTEEDEKRKLIKLVAVPWGYGASERTCADDLVKYRDESPHKAPYLNTLTVDQVNELVTDIVTLLEKRFPACVGYRDMVEKAVEAVSTESKKTSKTDSPIDWSGMGMKVDDARVKAGRKESIRWLTPSQWEVVQRKHYAKKDQVDIYGGPEVGDVHPRVKIPTNTIDWKKNKTSAPANLVHSMDASVIHMMLAYGEFKSGVSKTGDAYFDISGPKGSIMYPVATTHDAFHVHATNASDIVSKFKSALEELYKLNLLDSFLEQIRMLHDGDWSFHADETLEPPYRPRLRKVDLKQAKNILT